MKHFLQFAGAVLIVMLALFYKFDRDTREQTLHDQISTLKVEAKAETAARWAQNVDCDVLVFPTEGGALNLSKIIGVLPEGSHICLERGDYMFRRSMKVGGKP